LQLGAYREIYRVLKPGQYFALDELCLTDKFDLQTILNIGPSRQKLRLVVAFLTSVALASASKR